MEQSLLCICEALSSSHCPEKKKKRKKKGDENKFTRHLIF